MHLARCCADVVRLIDHRPGAADQPGGGARPEGFGQDRQDAGPRGREWRKLLDSIPATTLRDQRAVRALIDRRAPEFSNA
jgi:hypothetical protein